MNSNVTIRDISQQSATYHFGPEYLPKLDTLDGKVEQLNAAVSALTLTLNSPEPMINFDGDILNWTIFLTSINAIFVKVGNNVGLKYRILYSNLDAYSRARFLSDVDPTEPNIDLIMDRMNAAFESGNLALGELYSSYARVPSLNQNSADGWMNLIGVVNQTKIILSKFGLTDSGSNLAERLLLKLPVKFQEHTRKMASNEPLSLSII